MRNLKRLILFLLLPVLSVWGSDQQTQSLTNDVLITDSGIRFGLCDNFWEISDVQKVYRRTELTADQPLIWYLRETSSNRSSSVIFLGMSNSFAFDLKTPDGVSVPKTK